MGGPGDDEPAKQLLPFLQRAGELEKHDPKVAYYCRLYAAEQGMKLPSAERTPALKGLLMSLINQLEKDRKVVVTSPEDNLYVEGFAQNVFSKADKIDRAGKADLNTAKTFYASSIFFEVLRQFGTLQPELEQKQKYAIWKAADIRKALAEGRQPTPGPPGGDSSAGEAAELMAGLGPIAPTDTAAAAPADDLFGLPSVPSFSARPNDGAPPGSRGGGGGGGGGMGAAEPFEDPSANEFDLPAAPSAPLRLGSRTYSRTSSTSYNPPPQPPPPVTSPTRSQQRGARSFSPPSSHPAPDQQSFSGMSAPPPYNAPSPSYSYGPAASSPPTSSPSHYSPPSVGYPTGPNASHLPAPSSNQAAGYPGGQSSFQSGPPSQGAFNQQPPATNQSSAGYHPDNEGYSGAMSGAFQGGPPSYSRLDQSPPATSSPSPSLSSLAPSTSLPPITSAAPTAVPSVSMSMSAAPSSLGQVVSGGGGGGGGGGSGGGEDYAYDSSYVPPALKCAEAHKAARFAVSSLAFDDVPTAVSYLQRALQLLTIPNATI
eukprot:TRINITY_DN23445_c0_g1_i1.p1 TRINITY_DN23445_c0_g1~~TRINITY_DN23445_c0_g1_i1.p1  ORF type:complete len:541 (+),score=132.43 TRINITY_DN23445_c0_g1_i1:326-1948(+)